MELKNSLSKVIMRDAAIGQSLLLLVVVVVIVVVVVVVVVLEVVVVVVVVVAAVAAVSVAVVVAVVLAQFYLPRTFFFLEVAAVDHEVGVGETLFLKCSIFFIHSFFCNYSFLIQEHSNC
jgi:cobalamin synthase